MASDPTPARPLRVPEAAAQIALCMIVRDEEEMLPRCLASAQGVAGEIVVVDTGSTDRTPAIAEAAGARVVRFAWGDDFAAARNAALDAATRPWALVLDADEELRVEDPAPLVEAVRGSAPAGHLLPLRNLLGDGRVTHAEVFRLFRRDLPGMRYRGALHEQVIAVAEQRVPTGRLAGLSILHHGYAPEVVARKDKRARNLRLAESLVAARPADPFAWFSLGLERPAAAARLDAFRKALALAEAGGEAVLCQGWASHLLVHLAFALLGAGEAAEARGVVERGLSRFADAPDLLFARGRLRLGDGDGEGAAADLEACVAALASRPPLVFPERELAVEARTLAGVAHARAGRLDAAEAHLEAALRLRPADPANAERLLARLLVERGRVAEALPLLAARPEARPALQRAVLDLLASKPPAEAHEVLRAWHARDPSQPDACYWLGYAALQQGRPAEAIRRFREALAHAPDHVPAREGLRLLGETP